MADLIRNAQKAEFLPLQLDSEIKPQFPKEKYCQMVEKAKHYIHEGDIFQVVLSNPMRAKAEGSLFDTYRVLRATNPSPYMFYFSSDDIELAGASPETLVKLEDKKLTTFPLAGTRPRGKTKQEDRELEEGLLKDEKELAEHNMLVDLGRNDIGRISKIGTVEVEKYMSVEHFSQVMHIGSTVAGSSRQEHFPGHRSSVPARSSKNCNRANEAFTAARSDIWILQETLIAALRSVLYTRKKVRSASAPEQGS